MNTKEDAMIKAVKEVYSTLKTDDVFKEFSNSELMNHAIKIVSATQITTSLQAIDKSLEYIN